MNMKMTKDENVCCRQYQFFICLIVSLVFTSSVQAQINSDNIIPGGLGNIIQGPVGACCLPDGDCAFRPALLCSFSGGVFQGPGVSCSKTSCPQPGCGTNGLQCTDDQYCRYPTGDCEGSNSEGMCSNFPDGCLQIFQPVCGCDGQTYPNECTAQQAGINVQYNGVCEPFGACCVADGQCIYVSESDCEEQCGIFHGPSSLCIADPPPGGTDGGGNSFTPGPIRGKNTGQPIGGPNDIIPNPPIIGITCPVVDYAFGACCQPGTNSCSLTSECDCERQNGIWQGANTTCENSGCFNQTCGGPLGVVCPDGQFCHTPYENCGIIGTCQDKPEICPAIYDPVCGCNNITYGNACEAYAAGQSVLHRGACENVCGGLTGIECSDDQFCKRPAGTCIIADQTGICTDRPEPGDCPILQAPVCGCDGVTYPSPCFADAAGISISHPGPCLTIEVGACCYFNGPCEFRLEEDCLAECGVWGGPGSLCSDAGGGQGQPNITNDDVKTRNHADRNSVDSITRGDPIIIPIDPPVPPIISFCDIISWQVGACCIDTNAQERICILTTQCECEFANGIWQNGNTCDENTCDSDPPRFCGGIANFPCEEGEFCKLDDGNCCCDIPGECTAIPQACPDVYDPVCGCDGITYSNRCDAYANEVSVDFEGECNPDTGSCCLETGACIDNISEDECYAQCGIIYRPGESCSPQDGGNGIIIAPACPVIDVFAPFACCLPDGTCSGALPCTCELMGGISRPNVQCGDISCEQVPETCNPADETACPIGKYCKTPNGLCENPFGLCLDIPEACDAVFAPVCGCDNQTYSNACEAAGNGISISHPGVCETICTGEGNECDEDQVCIFPNGTCGDPNSIGICKDIPDICPLEYGLVTGSSYAEGCIGGDPNNPIQCLCPIQSTLNFNGGLELTPAPTAGPIQSLYYVSVNWIVTRGNSIVEITGTGTYEQTVSVLGDPIHKMVLDLVYSDGFTTTVQSLFVPDPNGFSLDSIQIQVQTITDCYGVSLNINAELNSNFPVCGCDGNTYPNRCAAISAGVSIDYAGSCGQACGGPLDVACPDGQFCETIIGECDEIGSCQDIPEFCQNVQVPVCGCDGVTYFNGCIASQNGVSIDHPGPCDGNNTGACCTEFGDCLENLTQEECQQNCGNWRGPGTDCQSNTGIAVCPIPVIFVGACCEPGGTCSIKTACQCNNAGGIFDPQANCNDPGFCGGQTCGGIAGELCGTGEYCDLGVGQCCCDFQGVCRDIPNQCPAVIDPVCGCDGITYGNSCLAAAAGVSIDSLGQCTN